MISGIYTITNIIDNKLYVGYTNNFKKREQSHFLELKKFIHKNQHLQRAVNKYGIENFKFEIIEECPKEYLISMEHYWCNLLDSRNRNYGYNIMPTNPLSVNGRHTTETKEKLSKSHKGKILSEATILKMKNSRTGKSYLTEEGRERIRNDTKNQVFTKEQIEKRASKMRGRLLTEEHKRKISEAVKGRKMSDKHKELLINYNKNKKVSEKTKSEIAKSLEKYHYIVINKNNETFNITNLKKFCRDNNIHSDGLRKTLITNSFSKGFKLIKKQLICKTEI